MGMQSRINQYLDHLINLVSSKPYGFDGKLHGSLPEEHGLYRIFEDGADWNSSLRVGRSKSAERGLRQRVYQNHYMGKQRGNIRWQLMESGTVKDLEEAKKYLEDRCKVQFIIIKEENERKWAEHFIISILQPQFCD